MTLRDQASRICDPKLIGAFDDQVLGQVLENRAGMVAVSGNDIAAAALRLQVMLAQQAADLLAVHHYALVAERRTHPPVAVALEFVADRADPFDDLVQGRRDGRFIVECRA
jgi:hypothetical protein